MATAEAIQMQIAEARRQLQTQTEAKDLARQEMVAAAERQRLRRELDSINAEIENERGEASYYNYRRTSIDDDRDGPHVPGEIPAPVVSSLKSPGIAAKQFNRDLSDCRDAVATGEMEWAIKGMSWLRYALKQNGRHEAEGTTFEVGGEEFDIIYNPDRRGLHSQHGSDWKSSLTVRHLSSGGLTFRYNFFIKHGATGEFMQWGATGETCYVHTNTEEWRFGPDVITDGDAEADDEGDFGDELPADGIFGLDHDALVHSQWVHDDTLTVKVEREENRDDMIQCAVGLEDWNGIARATTQG